AMAAALRRGRDPDLPGRGRAQGIPLATDDLRARPRPPRLARGRAGLREPLRDLGTPLMGPAARVRGLRGHAEIESAGRLPRFGRRRAGPAGRRGERLSPRLPTALLAATLLLGALALPASLAAGTSPARRLRPRILRRPIPFPARRKRQMAAYSERHYGERTWHLRHPHVIVEHWAEAGSAA